MTAPIVKPALTCQTDEPEIYRSSAVTVKKILTEYDRKVTGCTGSEARR